MKKKGSAEQNRRSALIAALLVFLVCNVFIAGTGITPPTGVKSLGVDIPQISGSPETGSISENLPADSEKDAETEIEEKEADEEVPAYEGSDDKGEDDPVSETQPDPQETDVSAADVPKEAPTEDFNFKLFSPKVFFTDLTPPKMLLAASPTPFITVTLSQSTGFYKANEAITIAASVTFDPNSYTTDNGYTITLPSAYTFEWSVDGSIVQTGSGGNTNTYTLSGGEDNTSKTVSVTVSGTYDCTHTDEDTTVSIPNQNVSGTASFTAIFDGAGPTIGNVSCAQSGAIINTTSVPALDFSIETLTDNSGVASRSISGTIDGVGFDPVDFEGTTVSVPIPKGARTDGEKTVCYTVNAYDTFGHSGEKTGSFSFTVDNTDPVWDSAEVSCGQNNAILTSLDDYITFTVSSDATDDHLVSGYTAEINGVAATVSGLTADCKASDLNLTEGESNSLTCVFTAADKAGNTAAKNGSATVILDATAPTWNDSDITAPAVNTIYGYATDAVEFSFTTGATDASGVVYTAEVTISNANSSESKNLTPSVSNKKISFAASNLYPGTNIVTCTFTATENTAASRTATAGKSSTVIYDPSAPDWKDYKPTTDNSRYLFENDTVTFTVNGLPTDVTYPESIATPSYTAAINGQTASCSVSGGIITVTIDADGLGIAEGATVSDVKCVITATDKANHSSFTTSDPVTFTYDNCPPTVTGAYDGDIAIPREKEDGSLLIRVSGTVSEDGSGVDTMVIKGGYGGDSFSDNVTYNAAAGTWSYDFVITDAIHHDPTTAKVVATDKAGHKSDDCVIELPEILAQLTLTNVTLTSGNTCAPGNATNADMLTLSYQTNNAAEITVLKIAGSEITGAYGEKSAGSVQIENIAVNTLTGLTADSTMPVVLTVKDKAGISKTFEDAGTVTYRAPLVVVGTPAHTHNNCIEVGGKYYMSSVASPDSSVKVSFTANNKLKSAEMKLQDFDASHAITVPASLSGSSKVASHSFTAGAMSSNGFTAGSLSAIITTWTDIYGQTATPASSCTMSDVIFDEVKPEYVADSLSFRILRKGDTSYSDYNGFVKKGDKVEVTFSADDNIGFSSAVKCSVAGVDSGLPVIDGKKATYTVVIPINSGTDEKTIEWVATFYDISGNVNTQTITGPTFYDNIDVTKVSVNDTAENSIERSSIDDDNIVRDGDKVTLTFNVNHKVNASFKLANQTTATPISGPTANGDSYTYTYALNVPNGAAADLGNISWGLTVNDDADNTEVGFDQDSKGSRIIHKSRLKYYKPITITDSYVTSNKTNTESEKYAKAGDTVTATFTTNHEIEASPRNEKPTIMLRVGGTTDTNTAFAPVAGSDLSYSYTFTVNNTNNCTGVTDGPLDCVYDLYDAACNRLEVLKSTSITKDTNAPVGSVHTITKKDSEIAPVSAQPKLVRTNDTVSISFLTTDQFSVRPDTVKVSLADESGDSEIAGTEIAVEGGNYLGTAAHTAVMTIPSGINYYDNKALRFRFDYEDLAGNHHYDVITSDIVYYAPLSHSVSPSVITKAGHPKATACRVGDTVYVDIYAGHPIECSNFKFYYGTEEVPNVTLSPEGSKVDGYGYMHYSTTVPDTPDLEDLTLISISCDYNDVLSQTRTDNRGKTQMWFYDPLGDDEGEIKVNTPPVISSSNKNDGTKYAKNDDNLYVDISAGHEVRVLTDIGRSSICTHQIKGSLNPALSGGNVKFSGSFSDSVRMSRVCINNETIDQTPIYCTFTVQDPAGNTYTFSNDSETAYDSDQVVIYYAPITVRTSLSPYGDYNDPELPYVRNGGRLYFKFIANHLVTPNKAQLMNRTVRTHFQGMLNGPYEAFFSVNYQIPYNLQGSYREGNVEFCLDLEDVAGNTYSDRSDTATDPPHKHVIYDRSRADVMLLPVFGGDGSKARINVRISDATLDINNTEVTVTGESGRKDVITLSRKGEDAELAFDKSGVYSVDVRTNDLANNPEYNLSFKVDVKIDDKGYDVHISSEDGIVIGRWTPFEDNVIYKYSNGKVNTLKVTLNNKKKNLTDIIRAEDGNCLTYSATTKNGKTTSFTFDEIVTVPFLSISNDVITK